MKVVIGMTAWRNIEAETVECLMATQKLYPGIGFVTQKGDALVERARSVLATWFLEETEADVLVTIDSDIIFRPADVVMVASRAMQEDIVAAVYATRARINCKPASFLPEGQEIEFGDSHELVACDWAASGFMAIHRRVLEGMAKTMTKVNVTKEPAYGFYPFFHTRYFDGPEGEVLLSEDWAFCQTAREAGFGVWVDPGIRLGHIGTYPYRLEDVGLEPPPQQPMVLTRDGLRYRVEREEATPAA